MPACSAAQWEGGTVPSVQEGPESLALSLLPVHQHYIELVMNKRSEFNGSTHLWFCIGF